MLTRLEGLVELDDAVPLGVVDLVGEQLRPGLQAGRLVEHRRQVVAVEDVVAEDQADGALADEVRPEQERLGDALGLGLLLY